MDALDVLRDLAARPRAAAARLGAQLNPVSLNARPGGHDNSVAWLLWHTGREIDVQLAELLGDEQLWTARGYDGRFALGAVGDSVGYGHSSAEARRIRIDDVSALLEYVDAALAAVEGYLERVTVEDLEDVVDQHWDPPVTRGIRLVSVLDDATQHLAQAAYVLGMPLRE